MFRASDGAAGRSEPGACSRRTLLTPPLKTIPPCELIYTRMRVLKFGGSSLATPARIRDVARIVLDKQRSEAVVVVVSAFQGVTNQLVECARMAERGDAKYERLLLDIARRHRSAAARLVRGGRRALRAGVEERLAELRDTLHGIYLLRHCPQQALDMTASFGERL